MFISSTRDYEDEIDVSNISKRSVLGKRGRCFEKSGRFKNGDGW